MTRPGRSAAAVETAAIALDERALLSAVSRLAARDPDLAGIVKRHGPPPLWAREPGVSTLTVLILEQQVSLSSARAVYRRLEAVAGGIDPPRLAALDETAAQAAGLTRQKLRYLRALGECVATQRLDLGSLREATDGDARDRLMTVPGIGRWTADVYLLMALGRPDVWPHGDLALAAAAQVLRRLPRKLDPVEIVALAEPWRPWRSVAARLLWHAYLSGERPSRAAARHDDTNV